MKIRKNKNIKQTSMTGKLIQEVKLFGLSKPKSVRKQKVSDVVDVTSQMRNKFSNGYVSNKVDVEVSNTSLMSESDKQKLRYVPIKKRRERTSFGYITFTN